jgi:hypothetical protein
MISFFVPVKAPAAARSRERSAARLKNQVLTGFVGLAAVFRDKNL